MKINREKFLEKLEMVRAGLSPREFIEQSSCFVFEGGMVMTFNDEIACRTKIDIDITGAIQATSLLDILGKLIDPELLVRENDKGELEFKGKSKGFGVTKDAEIFLPINRVEMPMEWKELPPAFSQSIGKVAHCVSTDESRFLLTCIHIHPDYIEACDNMQVMRVALKTGVKESMLVRGTSLVHISQLAMEHVALTKTWIHFKNKAGLIFSCRRYTEQYPELGPVIKIKGSSITLPRGLKEASERAAVFAVDRSGDPLLIVTLSNGVIRVVGEGLSGWYKEVKKSDYEGPAMEFAISPELLTHVSEKYKEAIICEDKLKVTGESWEYVTVLGKPKEKVEAPDEDEEEEKPKKKKKKSDEGE